VVAEANHAALAHRLGCENAAGRSTVLKDLAQVAAATRD
jgi:hypothetical protein